MRNHKKRAVVTLLILCWAIAIPRVWSGSQPAEPVDITPIGGQAYYILNQRSGLQADLNGDGAIDGSPIVQQTPGFTSLSQRWTFTKVPGGAWQIGNAGNGLCFASTACRRLATRGRETKGGKGGLAEACSVVERPCADVTAQQWTLTPAGNGYYTIANSGSGLVIDLSEDAMAAGAPLMLAEPAGAATQSQQWLLRPAFFRGIDNALLEKQEAARAAAGLPWWNDAGQPEDVLQIFKNHGVNMVRVRPSSVPPYANISQAPCTGNACYGETDAQDLDLAKRARNLGMSVELTLLFDGGSSASVPPAWSDDTSLTELQSDLYNYVKAEILSYRQAGAMPDLVSIGNEVDTGFLGALGSPTGADFEGFATLQISAMQAVMDAAADTAPGPAIPPPLTCIHITPAWDATQFFTLANQFHIPYDAVCQSYYPIYHGPLTDAQAAASNPGGKPVEQDVLVNAANAIGKPIFIIETGEHYESGFDANDPWYAPPSESLQSQFLMDLQGVLQGLPNHFGMGMEYWNPAGVNIPNPNGGFLNGDNLPNAIYIWNGLTLFDNADTSGMTNVADPNYATLLPAIDALGGMLDPASAEGDRRP